MHALGDSYVVLGLKGHYFAEMCNLTTAVDLGQHEDI